MMTDPLGIYFPATGVTVCARAVFLAVDNVSLPLKKNLGYYLSKPTVRTEPVLTPGRGDPNAPDALAAHFYGTVLHDGGRFRMWYYPVRLKTKRPPGSFEEDPMAASESVPFLQGPVCYAESGDGIRWHKPVLGQVLINGSRENNAIALLDVAQEGVTVIRDDDPDPQRRYKMVFNYRATGCFQLCTATSGDGLRWRVGPKLPIAGTAEHASFYKHNGLYIVSAQAVHSIRSEGGGLCGRQGSAFVSPDFDHWMEEAGESFFLAEPPDPRDRGHKKPYPQVHLGVGAASFGNVAVGLYCLWENRPQPEIKDWLGRGQTYGDLGLVVSNDGIAFREPARGHVYISRHDSPVTPVAGARYETILCQANGIMNVGEETRIYHGRWRDAPDDSLYWGEVALATLPRDRWGALGLFPGAETGSVWTTPVKLPDAGCDCWLNADGASEMCVEVADDRFRLIDGISGAEGGTTPAAGGIECLVAWKGKHLRSLAGQTVRFRVHVRRAGDIEPRLYAMYLKT